MLKIGPTASANMFADIPAHVAQGETGIIKVDLPHREINIEAHSDQMQDNHDTVIIFVNKHLCRSVDYSTSS